MGIQFRLITSETFSTTKSLCSQLLTHSMKISTILDQIDTDSMALTEFQGWYSWN